MCGSCSRHRHTRTSHTHHARPACLLARVVTHASRTHAPNHRSPTFVGVSGPEACAICNGSLPRGADPGCHQKLSRQSYNAERPFTSSVGLASSVFTLLASPGPEFKPWDTVKGYPTILGRTNVRGAIFAGFAGRAACGGPRQHPGAFAIGAAAGGGCCWLASAAHAHGACVHRSLCMRWSSHAATIGDRRPSVSPCAIT